MHLPKVRLANCHESIPTTIFPELLHLFASCAWPSIYANLSANRVGTGPCDLERKSFKSSSIRYRLEQVGTSRIRFPGKGSGGRSPSAAPTVSSPCLIRVTAADSHLSVKLHSQSDLEHNRHSLYALHLLHGMGRGQISPYPNLAAYNPLIYAICPVCWPFSTVILPSANNISGAVSGDCCQTSGRLMPNISAVTPSTEGISNFRDASQ